MPIHEEQPAGPEVLVLVTLEAHLGPHVSHGLVSEPLFKSVWFGYRTLQPETPSDFVAPHNPHSRKCRKSYLGSFSEEKSNFRIVVVAGGLQRGLACLRKGTGEDK